jgi:hypothetical protein
MSNIYTLISIETKQRVHCSRFLRPSDQVALIDLNVDLDLDLDVDVALD